MVFAFPNLKLLIIEKYKMIIESVMQLLVANKYVM